jgi:hypothetical protein
MNKNIIILTSILIILAFTLLFNSHVLNQLPWTLNLSFKKNITPYIVILIVTFACYQTINTIYLSLGLNQIKKSVMTKKVIGAILNIEYSTIRVGNSPRFKATIKYNSKVKIFDALPEQVQFHLKIGDKAVIYFNPNDELDSTIDINESIIENKNSTLDKNANFKINNITPKTGQIYNLIGEVLFESGDISKASFERSLTDKQLFSLKQDNTIPCKVTNEDGMLTIEFILDS